MSVKLHQRTESSLEFLNNAYKLRNLLIAKIKVDFKTSKERTEENKGRFENQPDWLIEDGRKCLINNLRQLTSNAIMGNNIYVVSEEDKNERRLYFTKAIGNCKI